MNQISNLRTGRKLLLSAIFLTGMSPSLLSHANAPNESDSYSLATYCPGEKSPACQDHESPKPSSGAGATPRSNTPGPAEPPGPTEPTDPTTPG